MFNIAQITLFKNFNLQFFILIVYLSIFFIISYTNRNFKNIVVINLKKKCKNDFIAGIMNTVSSL